MCVCQGKSGSCHNLIGHGDFKTVVARRCEVKSFALASRATDSHSEFEICVSESAPPTDRQPRAARRRKVGGRTARPTDPPRGRPRAPTRVGQRVSPRGRAPSWPFRPTDRRARAARREKRWVGLPDRPTLFQALRGRIQNSLTSHRPPVVHELSSLQASTYSFFALGGG